MAPPRCCSPWQHTSLAMATGRERLRARGVRAAGPPSAGKGLSPPRETVLKICQPRREGGIVPTTPPGQHRDGREDVVGKQKWFGGYSKEQGVSRAVYIKKITNSGLGSANL